MPEHITVADGGAKRGVMRDRSSFLPEYIRQCNVRIKGINGRAFVPEFMGTAVVRLVTDNNKVVEVLHENSVCVPDCPHDVVCPGSLCVLDWLCFLSRSAR